MTNILTLLEDLVGREHGPSGLAKVHALDPSHHRRDRSTPNREQVTVFMAGLANLRTTPQGEAYFWVGEFIVPQLLRALPKIQRKYNSLRSVLMHVNDLPAMGIQALVPDAEIPYFDVELIGSDSIRLIFTGPVEARVLLEGLILGFAREYEERVTLHSPLPIPARPDRRVTDVKFEDERRAVSRKETLTPTSKSTPRR